MQARKQRLCIKNATSAHAPQAAIFKSITGTSAALRCLQPSVSTSALEDNLGVTLQTNKFVTHCSFFVPLNRIVFVFSLFECKTLTSLSPVPAALITGPNGNPALEDENTHLEEKKQRVKLRLPQRRGLLHAELLGVYIQKLLAFYTHLHKDPV